MAITAKSVFKGITIEHVPFATWPYDQNRKAVFKGIAVERLLQLKKKADHTLFFGQI